MDDPALVRGREGPRDLERGGHRPFRRLRALVELDPHRFAFQIFRRDIELIVELFERVDGGNPGMRERRGGACLALEALALTLARRQLRRQRFQGDQTMEPRVFGLIDDAHAAATDQSIDPIRADHGAGGEQRPLRLGLRSVGRRLRRRASGERRESRPMNHARRAASAPRCFTSSVSVEPSMSDARSCAGTASACSNRRPTRSQRSVIGAYFRKLAALAVVHELALEPRPRHGPVALDGGGGDVEHFSGLLDAQAAEISKLDDFGLPLAHLGEPLQREIERDEVDGARSRRGRRAGAPRPA